MNKSDLTRNRYQLKGALASEGYDWWWHSFTGICEETGEEKSFFIEYYVVNPALAEKEPVLGQSAQSKLLKKKPSYAMIKCGHWGKGARQLHNYFSFSDFSSEDNHLDIKIGKSRLTEKCLIGGCSVSRHEAINNPEWMCDYGEMSWDLKVEKQIAYHVGYGASSLLRSLNAFDMYWHAEGVKTLYEGVVILDGRRYLVKPNTCFGYADKNWGRDFTSPWLWISSWDLVSKTTGKRLENSALEIGGGRPVVFKKALERELLVSFFYEGQVNDYNFSKFWTYSKVNFNVIELAEKLIWQVRAENKYTKLELKLTCEKSDMLLINYESPDGEKRHNRLWNGGTGKGELTFYIMKNGEFELMDTIEVGHAGCEYGEYSGQ